MNLNLLKIAIMAAVAYGAIQEAESGLLIHFRKSHPKFKAISDSDAQNATVEIYNKVSAGMETKFILQEIGQQLSMEQKNAAYALAREICVADSEVFPEEHNFISLLEDLWNIKVSTKNSVDRSIQLRYFTD